MSRYYRFIIFFFLLAFALPQIIFADGTGKSVFLSHAVEVEFVPEQAYFLIQLDGVSYRKIKAVLVPPFNKDEQDTNNNKWIVGGILNLPDDSSSLIYSVYLRGKADEAAFFPNIHQELEGEANIKTPESLKTFLIKQKEVLRSWQVQSKAQSDSVRRLRADADLIADVGRIVDVAEEAQMVQYETQNIDKDISALRNAFTEIKNIAQPKNYTRRELELTRQLSELVGVVRVAEAGEGQRKNQLREDMQYKLDLVESTRFDDEAKLVAELAELKKKPSSSIQNAEQEQKNYWELQ